MRMKEGMSRGKLSTPQAVGLAAVNKAADSLPEWLVFSGKSPVSLLSRKGCPALLLDLSPFFLEKTPQDFGTRIRQDAPNYTGPVIESGI